MPKDLLDWNKNGSLAAKFEIEVEYVHHLKELYKRVHLWLDEEGFKDFNGRGDYETLYWQRDLPNGLTEHHIWWRAYKHPGMEGKPQTQFTWFLKFNYQTIAVSKAEKMHKGKKWKMFQSNTIMRFEGHLITNFDEGFDNTFFLKGLKERWKKWIYKDRMKYFEDAFVGKLVELQDEIKAFLELRKGQETPPNIYPPSALP